jgi:hypothetical protein
LEEVDEGLLVVGEHSYMPLRAVYQVPGLASDSPANRRVLWVVQTIASFLEVIAAHVGPNDQFSEWQARAGRLLNVSPLRALGASGQSAHPVPGATLEETVDARYRLIYETYLKLPFDPRWTPTVTQGDLYTFVGYSDQIFQAFAAVTLARLWGLEPTAKALGAEQPAFRGQEWDVYYDTIPPAHILQSWRSYSTSPVAYRPDVLLYHKPSRQVVVADAKYRGDQSEAREAGRKEVLAYLGAFGIPRAVILFPTSSTSVTANVVAACDYALLEAALPSQGVPDEGDSEVLRCLIRRALVAPPWSDPPFVR